MFSRIEDPTYELSICWLIPVMFAWHGSLIQSLLPLQMRLEMLLFFMFDLGLDVWSNRQILQLLSLHHPIAILRGFHNLIPKDKVNVRNFSGWITCEPYAIFDLFFNVPIGFFESNMTIKSVGCSVSLLTMSNSPILQCSCFLLLLCLLLASTDQHCSKKTI